MWPWGDDQRGGCAINRAPYGLCVLGETFSFVHSDAPLMTVGARCPHLTQNFISSYTPRVSGQTKPNLQEKRFPNSWDIRLKGRNKSLFFMFNWAKASPPWVFSSLLSVLFGIWGLANYWSIQYKGVIVSNEICLTITRSNWTRLSQ